MNNKKTSSCKALFKDLPSIDQLYQFLNIDKVLFPRSIIRKIFRQTLASIRKDIELGKITNNIKKEAIDRANKDFKKITSFKLKNIINGTGIVLHTGLGRSPISKKIITQSINNIYPYSNLEINVEDNKRGDRNDAIQYILNPLIGSQSSIVVNNCAAALLLTLNTLSDNKEVIISRGQQVEIGGSFRIPEVVMKSNSIIRDVGTTNKTHSKDYQNVINSNTGLILYAHTSNYRVVGFTNKIKINELSKIAKKNKIPLIVDAGSGCIGTFDKFNMPAEKKIKEYFKEGADIVMFSGDKLLGGPQSGIIAGKRKIINLIKSNSLYRALRADKFTFALLENILRTYISDSDFSKHNLSLKLLTRDRHSLKSFGDKIINSIPDKIVKKYDIHLINTKVEAGSGAMPINSIESVGIAFNKTIFAPNSLSKKFRHASVPILGYIKDGRYIIDLKAIPEDCLEDIVKVICEILI